jgi:Lysozyme like domain
MADLSYAQLKAVWLDAAAGTKYDTNTWASLMAAIAEAESGGNPLATNPTDNDGTQTSWGLWQISLGNHEAPSPDWADPAENARLAIGKLNGQGLTAWGTYDSGAYERFLSDKTAADTSGLTSGPDAVTTAAATATANTQSDCLWPPSGRIGLPLGQSFTVPCLLSMSEARAMIGAALLGTGLLIAAAGLSLIVVFAGIDAFTRLANSAGSKAGAVGALVSKLPVAA